jgi:DNA-binding NarL/FixJ family response regulator
MGVAVNIKVIISCTDPLARAGLAALLVGQRDIDVVGQCERVREVLASLSDASDVVAVVSQPHDEPTALRKLGMSVKVITFAEVREDCRPMDILALNARAVLRPAATPDELLQAIRVVAVGDAVLMPMEVHRQVSSLIRHSATTRRGGLALQLTSRERDVLGLLAHGLSNADIACKLCVSEATVRSHVHHILQKFAVPSRAQAVIAAYEAGLVAMAAERGADLP